MAALITFSVYEKAEFRKVKVIVVKSNTARQNIELQFIETNGIFVFKDLYFGDYCFEFFDVRKEILATELISTVNKIQKGKTIVIVANNLKKKRWIGDAIFDLNNDDDLFGKHGYEKAMQRINKPRKLFGKLFKSKVQYEIYDWNSYRCIVK